ncbi:MAG: hypothetical protein LEGION0398_MBIBDBAK_01215 [Legionellaceae bacterium]
MFELLEQFKLDIKMAIEKYIVERAGEISNLPINRKIPCEEILNSLEINTNWKEIKLNIENILIKLKTGFWGRSKLKNYIRKILNDEKYKNEFFYQKEIDFLKSENRELLAENKRLMEELEKYKSGFVLSNERANNEKLMLELNFFKTENKKLQYKCNDLNNENLDLQQEINYFSDSSDSSNNFLESYGSFKNK